MIIIPFFFCHSIHFVWTSFSPQVFSIEFQFVPHVVTAALASMEDNAYADAEALEIGERPGRRRKASAIFNDRNLRNLARGLRNPPGNLDDAVLRYLEGAAHTFDNAFDEAVFED